MRVESVKFINLLLLFLSIIAVKACTSAGSINTEYDPAINFNQYRTFCFYQEEPAAEREKIGNHNLLLDQRLKIAIRRSLSGKGLDYDAINPDLKVAYDVAINDDSGKNEEGNYQPPYGYSNWYGYRYNYGLNRLSTLDKQVRQYKKGTIVIDLIDASTDELVWRGVKEAALDLAEYTSVEQVTEAVSNILEKFPPGED